MNIKMNIKLKADRKTPLIVFTLILIITATGCARMMGPSAGSEEALRKRVTTAWKNKSQGNWGDVYDTTTNFYKHEVGRDDFIRQASLDVRGFEIKDIQMTEPGKKARVRIKYEIMQMGFHFKPVTEEEWIYEQGEWRFNLQPMKYAPPPFGYGKPMNAPKD